MKQLDITVEQKEDVAVLVAGGMMDIDEVQKFERHLLRLLKDEQIKVVLDLSRLTYISSAGLGLIIGYIRELRRKGGDIKIGGMSERVQDILNTFGFSVIFDTFATREEAILKFKEL